MAELLNIAQAAKYLNVSIDTLRLWDKNGKLKPLKTPGGHCRYDKSILNDFIGYAGTKEEKEQDIVCATYAKVSSNEQKQKGNLDRQSQRLSEYCEKHNLYVEYIIKDCGSGLNYKRSGFIQLTDLVIKGKVNKVIVEHKDRLTRFQYNFIEKMYKVFGCEIIAVDDKEDVSDAEELTRDLMALLASFSGKYYGKRSLERRKKK